MSVRVKWTLMMSVIVAAVMAVTGSIVTQRQYAAMMRQVIDNGATLARFIALQNAVPILQDDWVSIDVALQESMRAQHFESITVVDRNGVVRAASDARLVGRPLQAPQGTTLDAPESGVKVIRYQAGGEPILGFEAPVTFQTRTVGRVLLGMAERPVAHVARLSILLMALLVLVTVAAVALATYFVSNWFERPIKLLQESMSEIAQGRFEHRIGEQRNDEFGLLYQAFDGMAEALARRSEPLAGDRAPDSGRS